jgi:hypothetical protein
VKRQCLRACSRRPPVTATAATAWALICIPFGNNADAGFCLPDCTAGADCGALSCDAELGLCVEGSPVEPTTGNACQRLQRLRRRPHVLERGYRFLRRGRVARPAATAARRVGPASCPETGAVCVGIGGALGFVCVAAIPARWQTVVGVTTLVCNSFTGGDPTVGFCVPQCNSDDDCGERVCGPDGLCVDEPPPECVQDEDCSSTQVVCGRHVRAVSAGTCAVDVPSCTPGVLATCSRASVWPIDRRGVQPGSAMRRAALRPASGSCVDAVALWTPTVAPACAIG